jgi:hypothetical protein
VVTVDHLTPLVDGQTAVGVTVEGQAHVGPMRRHGRPERGEVQVEPPT